MTNSIQQNAPEPCRGSNTKTTATTKTTKPIMTGGNGCLDVNGGMRQPPYSNKHCRKHRDDFLQQNVQTPLLAPTLEFQQLVAGSGRPCPYCLNNYDIPECATLTISGARAEGATPRCQNISASH